MKQQSEYSTGKYKILALRRPNGHVYQAGVDAVEDIEEHFGFYTVRLSNGDAFDEPFDGTWIMKTPTIAASDRDVDDESRDLLLAAYSNESGTECESGEKEYEIFAIQCATDGRIYRVGKEGVLSIQPGYIVSCLYGIVIEVFNSAVAQVWKRPK